MKKQSKKHRRRQGFKLDQHTHLTGDHAERLMAQSKDDLKWFQQHPGEKERVRLASEIEQIVLGQPPGATIAIGMMSNGVMVKTFFDPGVYPVSMDGEPGRAHLRRNKSTDSTRKGGIHLPENNASRNR